MTDARQVMWEMDGGGQILDTWIGRTIIRSSGQLSYEVAQEMIDGSWSEEAYAERLSEADAQGSHCLPSSEVMKMMQRDIVRLNKIAIKMRRERFQNGALTLESPKLHIQVDENQNPVSARPYDRGESHLLVEEVCACLARFVIAR